MTFTILIGKSINIGLAKTDTSLEVREKKSLIFFIQNFGGVCLCKRKNICRKTYVREGEI